LPDAQALERLFRQAGVGPARSAVASATPSSPLWFDEPEAAGPPTPAPQPADVALAEAKAEPEPAVELPPIAELTDERLGVEVFGAQAARLPVEQRLQRFLDWVMGGTGAFAAFVADTEGLPLVNHNAPESYVVAVGPMSRAQDSIGQFVPSPSAGSSTIELDHQNVLHVVWADTQTGRIAVGLVLAGPLERDMVQRVRRLTQLSFHPEGDA